MLDEYAKITESAEQKKTTVDESSLTDEFIEKLAKKVANVLMQSSNDNDNDNDNNDNDNNDNDNNDNDNDNNDNDNNENE